MPTWDKIALFLAATSVLVITPGPVIMYIIACTVDRGYKAGLISVIGVGVGTLAHVIAAAIGISAILRSSMLAFAVVKYAGAAYLIYLGIRALMTHQTAQQKNVSIPQSLTWMFAQGALINILNPKTALFFFAWLPRFIDPDRGSVAGQTVFFGCLIVPLGFCNDSVYVLLAGTASQWLRQNTRLLIIQRYFAGCVYLLLGITAVIAGTGKSS